MLVSPVNVKLGCALVLVVPVTEAAPADEDLNSIHGTATSLPAPLTLEAEEMPVLLDELVELVLLGVELLVAAPALDSEITANSSRPDAGLRMVSLILPMEVPELPSTGAPVN